MLMLINYLWDLRYGEKSNNFYKKMGVIMKHNEIIDAWKKRIVLDNFKGCLDETAQVIHAPSKTTQS